MAWLSRLAVVGAIVAAVGGTVLLQPCIRKTGVPVATNTVRADRLQIGENGAVRHEHGGDSGDKVKHLIVPHVDCIAEVFYDANRNTVTASQETYSATGADGQAQMKSRAVFNSAGTAATAGTVWRPDGSIWMDYQRLANGDSRRLRYTQQPDSRLLVREIIHEVGGKPPRPQPAAHNPSPLEQKKNESQDALRWFLGGPQTDAKDPSTVRTMNSTFFRQSGKKWAHLQFQWNSGWWTSGTPSRYVTGSWRMSHPVIEFFREEDETLQFKMVDERDRRWVTYYRSDGSVDYAQLWLQNYNPETGISYRLAGVDEYDPAGKIRRTLAFDEDGQAVSLLAVQTPQAAGTRVVRLTKAVSGCSGTLIESFGQGSIYRNSQWVDAERQRRLYIGPVDRVVQPDGQVAADKDIVVDVDPGKLKFPEKYPAWEEFARVRSEFERESQEFLGARDDSDPCRWYLNGEPEPTDQDEP